MAEIRKWKVQFINPTRCRRIRHKEVQKAQKAEFLLCVSLRISVPSAVNRLSAHIYRRGHRDTQRYAEKIGHHAKYRLLDDY